VDSNGEKVEHPHARKIRYAWYASLEDALAQAEHEMGTKEARDRMRAEFGKPDLELHPSGIEIIRVEDADGNEVWSPPRSHTSKFAAKRR
jgi:hypothetical protein